MKCLILSGPNQPEVKKIPAITTHKKGEVIADVKFVGVCKTDHQLTKTGIGKELIPGHEVVCTVPGKKGYFALNNEISCGKCTYCAQGSTSLCINLKELGVNENGGYAEQICVPEDSLHYFDFSNPGLGVLIEPLSCAVHGAERILAGLSLLPVRVPEIMIIGAGVSGALITYLLAISPKFKGKIYVHEITDKQILWINYLANNLTIERIKEPKEAHLVVECSGSPEGLDSAFRMVRNAGLVAVYGVPKQGIFIPVSASELFYRELAVLTCFAGVTDKTIESSIKYIKNNEGFFEQLLGRFISLEKLPYELTNWNPKSGTRTVVDIKA